MSVHANLDCVPEVKHELGNVRSDKRGKNNTINNLKYAVLTETTADVTRQTLVEVVRRGRNSTRIRRDLSCNAETELVKTADLSDFHKRENSKTPAETV
jgi:hypothetical protein